jgi:DGQHR domain-containing protein
MAIERPCLIEVQRGVLMVSTTLHPTELEAVTAVDVYDPARSEEADNGYQRKASQTRAAQAAAFYGEGVERRQGREHEDRRGLMPNPIIANIRSAEDNDDVPLVAATNGAAHGVRLSFYSPADEERIRHALETEGHATAAATVLFTDEAKAWIVDGQHRTRAMRLLNDKDRIVDDFPVPFKITLNLPRGEEIKQFFYINSQAKSVPTDLTAELLQRMARQDDAEAQYLEERKGKGGLLKGAAVYEEMKSAKSPWLTRIRKPNEPSSKDTSIAISQFINSLGPLFSTPLPRELSPGEWARVIDAFWAAVEEVLSTPFDPTEQPGNWVLFKSTGVNVMHRVLADCVTIVVQRGGRLSDPDEYVAILQELPELRGELIDSETGETNSIAGSEFWRSSSVASQYTGRYGADRLVGMIRGLIAKAETVTV